ncbi:MAG: hypothetical protein ACJ74W_16745 [Pyrinomonadaceae bacterium]
MRASIITCTLAGLLCGLSAAYAQAPTASAPNKPSTTIKQTVQRDGNYYTVYVDYDYREAWAGNTHLNINVAVETIGMQTLKLIRCEKCEPENSIFASVADPVLVDGGQPSQSNTWRLVYRLVAALKPDADPQEYDITLRFEPPVAVSLAQPTTTPDIFVHFPLYVGVREKGRLAVKEPDKLKPEPATSGRTHQFVLTLHNYFHDYDANVQQLTVDSDPAGLVARVVRVQSSTGTTGTIKPDDPSTIIFNTPLNIAPAQEVRLTLDLEMAGMSSGNFISGFDDDAQVTFAFIYDDGKQRTISDYNYNRPVRLRPSNLVLLLSIALGVAAGVFIMSVWKVVRFEGDAKRRWLAVLSTVIIGLIVSILALQGELNISAFNLRASYDKPVMLFILSLFATVSGTPLLKKFFGLDKAGADDETTPSTPSTQTPTPTGSH